MPISSDLVKIISLQYSIVFHQFCYNIWLDLNEIDLANESIEDDLAVAE